MYEIIGVGVGPNNLSIAALLNPLKKINTLFLEKKESVEWHKGIMLDNSTLQNSINKDLVTLADPTSKFSYLNFLYEKNRIYEFITSGQKRAFRCEYEEYLQWVANQLNNIEYNKEVSSIEDCEDYFKIKITDGLCYEAKNIILSVGRKPHIPFLTSSDVFHSSEYLNYKNDCAGKRILILGGGQSSAEIFYDLLNSYEKPEKIIWLSSRDNFKQINESCFDNELYSPQYVKLFSSLDEDIRNELLSQQRMTSDGINPELLEEIYLLLYKNKFLESNKIAINLYPFCEVKNILYQEERKHKKIQVQYIDKHFNLNQNLNVDKIILCTGYKQNQLPSLLNKMIPQPSNKSLLFNNDYSIYNNKRGKIFVINAGISKFGINDPNISLVSWRASVIINSIFNKEYYKTPHKNLIWSSDYDL